MTNKEIIGKLTPACFEQGENFDRDVFAVLVTALQKQASRAWVYTILSPLSLILAGVLEFGVGGIIGNGMALAIIFLVVALAAILTGKTNRQIKSAKNKLGITKSEINMAIRQLKKENGYIPSWKTVWFYSALSLSFLIYIAGLITLIGGANTIISQLLIIAGSIVGIAGAVLFMRLNLKGMFFVITSGILMLIGSMIPTAAEIGGRPAGGSGGGVLAILPIILLLSIIPIIKEKNRIKHQ